VLPLTWVYAAWPHPRAPASEADATTMLLGSCAGSAARAPYPGWLQGAAWHAAAAQRQFSACSSSDSKRFAGFEALARSCDGNGAQPDGATVTALLLLLCRLSWDNKHTDVFWRLALNALPVARRPLCMLAKVSVPF
jgi:hypothetical protein